MINFNIYTENTYEQWEVDSEKISKTAQEIFNFYLKTPEIANHSCLKSYEFDTVSFDFLFCDSNKTHEINKEYREKDYPADIITFAIFADSPEEEKYILSCVALPASAGHRAFPVEECGDGGCPVRGSDHIVYCASG